jgi:protein O-GlcNAcase/histone acetyltransferase
MFVQLTDIPNRALLYDLYPYIWDVKEVVMLLDAYIAWLGIQTYLCEMF